MSNQRRSPRRASKKRPGRSGGHDHGVIGKLLIVLAIVAAIVLGVAIFFQVNQVEVQGNLIYSADQIVEASGLEVGDNLLMVNKAAVTGKIEAALPYVQNISVGRILPDTVVIKIQESQIAGLVKADVGSSWYVNLDGRVLGSSLDGFHGQVIELTGYTITAPQAGQLAKATEGMEGNMAASLQVLSAMDGTGLMDQVTTIDTEKIYDVKLLCGEQYEVVLGGTTELDYKIWYLQEVLATLDNYQMGTIDLSLDEERAAHFIPWIKEE